MMASATHDGEPKQQQQRGLKIEMKEHLRAELKAWERAFQKKNGHKPTPVDVKANPDISAKYKLYHKSFRIKPLTKAENSHVKTEYVSTVKALKQITPHKRIRDSNVITPIKGLQQSDDTETVGPTPQVNGRMLGLFDSILEQTPVTKRRLNWGEQLAEARKESPNKSTPRRRLPKNVSHPDSPMEETPTKSTSSARSPFTTPTTQPPSVYNQHAFATPAFLRPTAMPIDSPQSPSLLWKRIPGKIKSLSALISDYRANQQQELEEVDHEAWEDEDELQITQEHDVPGVAGRKPWMKNAAKRTTRRVISINPPNPGLMLVRPVPQLEVPPSDDEEIEQHSPAQQAYASSPLSQIRATPELSEINDVPGSTEDRCDLEEARDPSSMAVAVKSKTKGKYRIGKQVSSNFISYKIRSKGRRGRMGNGRFRRH